MAQHDASAWNDFQVIMNGLNAQLASREREKARLQASFESVELQIEQIKQQQKDEAARLSNSLSAHEEIDLTTPEPEIDAKPVKSEATPRAQSHTQSIPGDADRHTPSALRVHGLPMYDPVVKQLLQRKPDADELNVEAQPAQDSKKATKKRKRTTTPRSSKKFAEAIAPSHPTVVHDPDNEGSYIELRCGEYSSNHATTGRGLFHGGMGFYGHYMGCHRSLLNEDEPSWTPRKVVERSTYKHPTEEEANGILTSASGAYNVPRIVGAGRDFAPARDALKVKMATAAASEGVQVACANGEEEIALTRKSARKSAPALGTSI